MPTPVEEFAAFNITEAMELAKKEFEEHGRLVPGTTTYGQDGEVHLTVRGYWRIILHEEVRIKALKRQVNRLISGNTIEGDEVLYPEEEC